jgi:hypothetical protein
MPIERWLARLEPDPTATPGQVRVFGLRIATLGVVLVAFGIALVFSIDRVTHGALLGPAHASRLRFLSGLPMLFGWLLVVMGVYRAVTGIAPRDDGRSFSASFGRLVFASLTVSIVLAGMIFALLRITR